MNFNSPPFDLNYETRFLGLYLLGKRLTNKKTKGIAQRTLELKKYFKISTMFFLPVSIIQFTLGKLS